MTTPAPKSRGRGPAPRALLYDAFSGRRMEMKHIPQQGSYIMRNQSYFFGPFKTENELLTAFSMRDGVPPIFKIGKESDGIATPPRGAVRAAPTRPLTQCPYTGKKVVIAKENPEDPISRWCIRGEKYFIGGFQTERQAQHYFSTRDGVPPAFSALDVEAVAGDEKPDDVQEGLAFKEMAEASTKLADAGFAGKKKG